MRWALLGLALEGCVILTCTDVYCRGAATWVPELDASIDPNALAISMCRNDFCVEAPLAGVSDGTVSIFDDMEQHEVEAAIEGGVLEITWADDGFSNGDRWRAVLTDASGSAVAELPEETVDAYTESRPNGPGCGPVCRSVTLGE